MIQHYTPDDTKLNGILQKGSRSLFSVSASTTWADEQNSFRPEQALDDENTYYHSETGDPDPHYIIEFKNYFYLQSYTFKTRHDVYGSHDYYPWKWSLYGSFNSKDWTYMDDQETTELKGIFLTKNFPVTTPNIFKFFKFTNFTTYDQFKYFVIRSIDFFGYHVPKAALQGGISISLFPGPKLSAAFFYILIK